MLDNKQEINIAAVQIPEKSKSTPRDKYEALKRTPLYDRERDQWNYEMDEKGNITPDRGANNHLLSVLIDFQLCGKQFAEQKLERLKQIGFYDAENDSWMGSVNEKQELQDVDYYCVDQLLYVFVETKFDKEKAKEKFGILKKSLFYDPDTGLWNELVVEVHLFKPLGRTSSDQLLAILIEAQFDKHKANENYEALKKTNFYDPETEQWIGEIDEKQNVLDSDRYSFSELLDILIVAQFDKQLAKEEWGRLKKTVLYDPETGLWKICMNFRQEQLRKEYTAADQLLAILIEHILQEPEVQIQSPLSLPETRAY